MVYRLYDFLLLEMCCAIIEKGYTHTINPKGEMPLLLLTAIQEKNFLIIYLVIITQKRLLNR